METYFTSDSHFYHKNILSFEERPFSSVNEMTEVMIETWNAQVNENDLVYHLGDLCLGNYEQLENVIKRLKGRIILIKGNHDQSKHYKRIVQLGLLHEYHEVGIELNLHKHKMWLTHYPFEIGLRPRKWSIHGHIHSQESSYVNQLNVGVDSPLFQFNTFGRLIHIDELLAVMEARTHFIEAVWAAERNR